MNSKFLLFFLVLGLGLTSCVSKKKFTNLQMELDAANKDIGKLGEELNAQMAKTEQCEQEKRALMTEKTSMESKTTQQIADLNAQVEDLIKIRDAQMQQVGNLTVLSQAANDNIKATLQQLEGKDKYIQMLQAARTKTDSINLALAVNLKSALAQGIDDNDIQVQVDKTVVMINLSDKMLYRSGSAKLSSRASEVLGKVASIIKTRPDLEVMVEGYTDNVPVSTACVKDNWDLSVQRATAVVRVLQEDHEIDPNRLIAAGRGEYNALASNETKEGRSTNRRTRIIILPKLDESYALLKPDMAQN